MALPVLHLNYLSAHAFEILVPLLLVTSPYLQQRVISIVLLVQGAICPGLSVSESYLDTHTKLCLDNYFLVIPISSAAESAAGRRKGSVCQQRLTLHLPAVHDQIRPLPPFSGGQLESPEPDPLPRSCVVSSLSQSHLPTELNV